MSYLLIQTWQSHDKTTLKVPRGKGQWPVETHSYKSVTVSYFWRRHLWNQGYLHGKRRTLEKRVLDRWGRVRVRCQQIKGILGRWKQRQVLCDDSREASPLMPFKEVKLCPKGRPQRHSASHFLEGMVFQSTRAGKQIIDNRANIFSYANLCISRYTSNIFRA